LINITITGAPALIQVKPRAEAKLAAKSHELRTNPADRRAIVFAEVGNRLVIGNQAAGQPHDLDIAAGFALQTTARLHPVEITVDVNLEKNRRVRGRTAGRLRVNTAERQFAQISSMS
jgi:hypothetical protein